MLTALGCGGGLRASILVDLRYGGAGFSSSRTCSPHLTGAAPLSPDDEAAGGARPRRGRRQRRRSTASFLFDEHRGEGGCASASEPKRSLTVPREAVEEIDARNTPPRMEKARDRQVEVREWSPQPPPNGGKKSWRRGFGTWSIVQAHSLQRSRAEASGPCLATSWKDNPSGMFTCCSGMLWCSRSIA